ncbi:MAG: CopD family protein [Ruminococcaceae bacterium]|nr:CopD family protein [Oscillospiraceae bacterium]
MILMRFFKPYPKTAQITQKIIYALLVLIVLAIALLVCYLICRRRVPRARPSTLIRNMLIITLVVSLLAVGIVHTVDFSHRQASNVFEEIYNDYTKNGSELLSNVPIFRSGEEFYPGEFMHTGVYDHTPFSYTDGPQADALGEEKLDENEYISFQIHYGELERLEFHHYFVDNSGNSIFESTYTYDLASKTLSYESSDPDAPRDTFLEDRILDVWFKCTSKDSEFTSPATSDGPSHDYFTKFSADDWGEVVIAWE